MPGDAGFRAPGPTPSNFVDIIYFFTFTKRMGRPALQPEAISEFRERLCDAAHALFAERGYEGFTLRALGEPMEAGVRPYEQGVNRRVN